MFGAEEATSFAQSGVDSVLSKKMSEKEFEQNKYMQEYAFEKNKEMWDLSNDFNLPVNQMQRLRDAGISPHLAYAKGTINNVGSSQLPKYSGASMKYNTKPMGLSVNNVSGLGDYYDLKKKKADADIGGAIARTEGAKASISEGTIQTQIDTFIAELEKKRSETNNVNAKKLYTDQLKNWALQKTKYATKIANMAENEIFPHDHIITRILNAALQSMVTGSRGKNIVDDFGKKYSIE